MVPASSHPGASEPGDVSGQMMSDLSAFHGPNAGYVLDLYDRYLQDPTSVDPDTRATLDRKSIGVIIPTCPFSQDRADTGVARISQASSSWTRMP